MIGVNSSSPQTVVSPLTDPSLLDQPYKRTPMHFSSRDPETRGKMTKEPDQNFAKSQYYLRFWHSTIYFKEWCEIFLMLNLFTKSPFKEPIELVNGI